MAEELAVQFGRGNLDMQLSLSLALVSLGGEVIQPVLQKAIATNNPHVHAHARATERLLLDPNAGFELAVKEAKRILLLGKGR